MVPGGYLSFILVVTSGFRGWGGQSWNGGRVDLSNIKPISRYNKFGLTSKKIGFRVIVAQTVFAWKSRELLHFLIFYELDHNWQIVQAWLWHCCKHR